MTTTKLAICEGNGYISLYDYKQNREQLYRARLWKNITNVDKYLTTDSYRRLAKYVTKDLQIQEIEITGTGDWSDCYNRKVLRTIRTIPLAQVQADAALASTRAERRAHGLKR